MVVCAAAVDVSSVVVVVIVHSSKDGLAKLRCKSHSKTRLIKTNFKIAKRICFETGLVNHCTGLQREQR